MSDLVMSVTSVCLNIKKSNPPQVEVEAEGKVNSSGWSKPTLTPVEYVDPPQDGIQEYHFRAIKPTGPTPRPIEKIEASHTMLKPDWMRGAKVVAKDNALIASFDADSCRVSSEDRVPEDA